MASENFDTYQAPQLRGFNRVALPPEEPKLTAAQSAYIAANLVPGAGYADFVGAMSEMPEAGVPVSQALSGPPSPGFIENIKTGHPWIAALQALGLAGDVLYPLKGIAGLKMMAMLPAYHGSPHLFDKFKMSEIGTGQGAQAYGHGLYFAENPAVAKEYRFIGNRDVFDNVKYKGRKVSEIYEDANKKMDAAYARGHRSGNFDNDEIERLANETYFWEQIMTGWHPEKLVRDILADPDEWGEGVADIARRVSSEGKWEDLDALRGTLYKVDIDETTIDQMLDWDLPLAEQPDVMKKLLDSGILETKTEAPYAGSLRISRTGVLLDPSDDGFSLVRSGGWDKKLSDDLLEAGIPGIKYFDQGSRNAFGDATEGTRNFVVFDEDIPEMVSKTQATGRFANGGAVQLGGFNRVDLPPPEQQLSAAQAAYIAAQFDPTVITGAADIIGGYPEFPSRDVPLSQAFSGEPMPSLIENVREGNLGIAALQALGAIPGIGAITRGRRVAKAASDAARASRGITASEPVNKMRVIAEFAEKHPTAFKRLFTRGKKKISRSKFESGDPSAVERVYARVSQKQKAIRAYAEEAEWAARHPRKTLFWPGLEEVESNLERLGYRAERHTDPVTGESWWGSSSSYNPESGGSSISNYYVHPDTGKTVRVSDHAPVWPRSSRDVMIHPGSFDSYDDLVTSLERSSRATRTK